MEERLIAAFRKLPLAVKKSKLWLLEYSASAYDIDTKENGVNIKTTAIMQHHISRGIQ